MGWGMKQLTLATAVFERYAKTTRRAIFLPELERVVPRSALCKLIEPFYPKPGNGRAARAGAWLHWMTLTASCAVRNRNCAGRLFTPRLISWPIARHVRNRSAFARNPARR